MLKNTASTIETKFKNYLMGQAAKATVTKLFRSWSP